MIARELLDILCCPETKQDLELIQGASITKINEAIGAARVTSRGGETVKEKIDCGLLRADRAYLYPIREDIPIMLIDEAIPWDEDAFA